MIITTQFTPQMISIPMEVVDTNISIKRITVKQFKEDMLKAKGKIVSAIKYQNVANIISSIVDIDVETSTEPVRIVEGESIYQVRVIGPRLSEDATELGKENKLQVYKITYLSSTQRNVQPK